MCVCVACGSYWQCSLAAIWGIALGLLAAGSKRLKRLRPSQVGG